MHIADKGFFYKRKPVNIYYVTKIRKLPFVKYQRNNQLSKRSIEEVYTVV